MAGAALRLALIALFAAAPAPGAEVEGALVIRHPGLSASDVAPTVVYLEPEDAALLPTEPRPAVVRQRNARFSPPFLAVAVGQRVEMPNDDTIFHNVFSFSAPNDFDLGLYPAGQSRAVTFSHPGVVQLYCSIHESMNASIFVSPTPWFAVADETGRFHLAGVPEGRFRLRTWSRKLPASEQPLDVGPGRNEIRLVLGPRETSALASHPPER